MLTKSDRILLRIFTLLAAAGELGEAREKLSVSVRGGTIRFICADWYLAEEVYQHSEDAIEESNFAGNVQIFCGQNYYATAPIARILGLK